MDELKGRTEILKRNESHVYISLYIEDGCLKLDSEVYGDDYDSEAHYCVDEINTKKLLKNIADESNVAKGLKHLFRNDLSSSNFESVCNKFGIKYSRFVI